MMTKLPELLQEWLDGELTDEDYRDFIRRDEEVRRRVRDERQLRVLVGHALGGKVSERPGRIAGHIGEKDMAAYLDEGLPPARMRSISGHLVKCRRCFQEYMKLYLLDLDGIEPEPLPAPFHHRLLQMIKPNRTPVPDWLGELVLQARGGIEWLFEPPSSKSGVAMSAEPTKDYVRADDVEGLDEEVEQYSLADMAPTFGEMDKLERPRMPELVRVEVAGLELSLLQRRERGARALAVDVVTADLREPVPGLELVLELSRGEATRVVTDKHGHAYFLVPRGRSRLRIGYRGHFDVVVE